MNKVRSLTAVFDMSDVPPIDVHATLRRIAPDIWKLEFPETLPDGRPLPVLSSGDRILVDWDIEGGEGGHEA